MNNIATQRIKREFKEVIKSEEVIINLYSERLISNSFLFIERQDIEKLYYTFCLFYF